MPKGASTSNPYWQRLAIVLTRNPSAGNTISISLPADISIADLDGDGSVEDEIALDDSSATGTGYTSVAGSTSSRILLTSGTGGTVGKVYVHYPIITPAQPVLPNAIYGQIAFSNPNEQSIPAGGLVLELVEPRQLRLATFSRLFVESAADTATNAQGDAYPEKASPAFSIPLPDLLSDRRGHLTSNAIARAGIAFADGNDGNDTRYHFWLSLRDTLDRVDTTVAVRATNRLTRSFVQGSEGDSLAVAFDATSLLDTTTYYVYMTSDLTGHFPLMRSRGIAVRHKPVVLGVGSFLSGDADFIDSGRLLSLDKGSAGPVDSTRAQVAIPFQVIDYDDSASVKLFYATADTLDTTFVQTTGTVPNRVISGLKNAAFVDSSTALFEGRDAELNWKIARNDSVFVARGNYYVYAVISDGKSLGIRRSTHTYNVRHSPLLILDSRENRTVETGGSKAERYYAITWNGDNGIGGDVARGDSALIALYYSDSSGFAVPSGAAELEAAAADSTRDTHRIVSGLQEKPDGRADNQYVWDLWRYKNPDGGGVPKEGVDYALYGIVQNDSTRRVVRWNDAGGTARKLRFIHRPHLRVLSPLHLLEVNGRSNFEVVWEAIDVDGAAQLWVVLTSAAAASALGDSTHYAALVGDGASDWVANSVDGSMAAATALSEDSTSALSVRPARMTRALDGSAQPLTNGDYYAYVLIAESASAAPPDSALARRASGRVRISGLGPAGAAGLDTPDVEFVPAELTMSAPIDTARIEVRPHSGGAQVDLLSFFASVDTTFFTVVDQDASLPGIQPFKLNPQLSGIVLRDTLLVGVDSLNAGKYLLDLVYYEQQGNRRFDGELSLASIQLVCRDTTGASTVSIDHLGNRQSAFFRDGSMVALLPPETAMRIRILPRGSIRGRVALQGRPNPAGIATLMLRDRNSFAPIADSLFVATNDLDRGKDGIQDSLASDGSFDLLKVPSGEYQLAVHVDGYLDGQYPLLRVDPGTELNDINPTRRANGIDDPGYLVAGDITGYVDTNGVSIPDNEIDQLDVDFVVAYFGQKVVVASAGAGAGAGAAAPATPLHPGHLADIDGDSLVWIADLNVVAANFNQQGVAPVYKVAVPLVTPAPWHTVGQERDGLWHVDVVADGLVDARALAFRLFFDESVWRVEEVDVRAFAGRPAIAARKMGRGELAMGIALSGYQRGETGSSPVARIALRRIGEGPAAVQLRDTEWVDGALVRYQPLAARVVPAAFALLPNYPNPFNPETQLRFTLPAPGRVTLEIYDGLGQRVRTLIAEQRPAGFYTVAWDGRDQAGRAVASGAYLAHLRSGEYRAVRKMLLLR